MFSLTNVLIRSGEHLDGIDSSLCMWRIHGAEEKYILLELSLVPSRWKRFEVSNTQTYYQYPIE